MLLSQATGYVSSCMVSVDLFLLALSLCWQYMTLEVGLPWEIRKIVCDNTDILQLFYFLFF